MYKLNVVWNIYEEIATMIAKKYWKDLDWKEEPKQQDVVYVDADDLTAKDYEWY
jgi:hypothetical protein